MGALNYRLNSASTYSQVGVPLLSKKFENADVKLPDLSDPADWMVPAMVPDLRPLKI